MSEKNNKQKTVNALFSPYFDKGLDSENNVNQHKNFINSIREKYNKDTKICMEQKYYVDGINYSKIHSIPIEKLKELKENILNAKDIYDVMSVVEQIGIFLYFADDKFKNNKEIVLAAVDNYGKALEFASEPLKNNKEVVLAAVQQCGNALEFASDSLKNNKEVVITAIKNNHLDAAIQFASERLKNNEEIARLAVFEYPPSIEFLNMKLRDNKEIALIAMKNSRSDSGDLLEFTSDRLKDDKYIVSIAILDNYYAFTFASERLKKDEDIIKRLKQSIKNSLSEAEYEKYQRLCLQSKNPNGDELIQFTNEDYSN